MKEYQVNCNYLDKKTMNLDIIGVVVRAENEKEAEKQALDILEKQGKAGAFVGRVIERSQQKNDLAEQILNFAELSDTYEQKVKEGQQIIGKMAQYLAFDKDNLLYFLMAIRAACNHFSNVDGEISFKEFCYFYDIVQMGNDTPKKMQENYKSFLAQAKKKKNSSGSAEELAFGKSWTEKVLRSNTLDPSMKFDLLRLAALFFTVDGVVSEEERNYMSALVENLQ